MRTTVAAAIIAFVIIKVPTSAAEPLPTGTVRGRVLSPEGLPVGFAKVVLAGENASRSAVADEAGRVQFRDVPVGTYRLTGPDFDDSPVNGIVVTAGSMQSFTLSPGTKCFMSFTLVPRPDVLVNMPGSSRDRPGRRTKPLGVVRGQVLTKNGFGVGFVDVEMHDATGVTSSQATLADENGRFLFPEVPANIHRLSASSDGQVVVLEDVLVTAGTDQSFTLTLQPDSHEQAAVVSAGSRERADVTLVPIPESDIETAEVNFLGGICHWITKTVPSALPCTPRDRLGKRSRPKATVEAQAPARLGIIRGHLTEPHALPLRGVEVVLTASSGDATWKLLIDAEGAFESPPVPPGNYTLEAPCEGCTFDEIDVKPRPGNFEITLPWRREAQDARE